MNSLGLIGLHQGRSEGSHSVDRESCGLSIGTTEKKIFEEIFGKEKIEFGEYKTKGMIGGAFDIQIIVDILNDPIFTAMLHGSEFIGLFKLLIKNLLDRKTKSIMDNGVRLRSTKLVQRKESN